MLRRSVLVSCAAHSRAPRENELFDRAGGVLNYAEVAEKMSVPENYVRLLVGKNRHNVYVKKAHRYPAQFERTSKPGERASQPSVMFPLYEPKKDVSSMKTLNFRHISTQ